MREDEDDFEGANEQHELYNESIKRYEEMKRKREHYFFDVDALQRIIDHYIDQADFDQAFEVTNYALSLHPLSQQFKIKEAQLNALTGHEQKGLMLIKELERNNPFDLDIILLKGSILNSMERYKDAIACYLNALNLADDPKDDIYLSLGIAHQNMADYSTAVDYFAKCLSDNPEHETAMDEALISFELSGRMEEGKALFNNLIDKHPYNYTAWYYLANVHSRLAEYEQALHAFDYSIIIKEDFAPAHLDLAHTLAQMERYDEAIKRYKIAFEYSQPDAFVYFNIGECYEQLELWPEARDYYKKAVKLMPEMAQAWYGIGETLEGEERWYEAVHYLKKALEIDNSQPDYWYALADCEYRLLNYEEAEKCYRQALDYEPENPEIWISYADMISSLNRTYEAIELMNTALTYQPTHPELLYRSVCFLYMAGYLQEAYQQLDVALMTDYSQHTLLFEVLPQLEKDSEVLNRITQRRS